MGPDERVVDLADRPAGMVTVGAAGLERPQPANNLPVLLTNFVGRAVELAAVEQLLGRDGLVTLAGSGGCGKTRLAVQAAARLVDRWPDGVWWVDLGPVTDPVRVAELTADTVGVMVEPSGGPLLALTQALCDRRLLVCLDNCEQVLDATAELADTLLRSCPEVSVLATSREPLGLPGETVWRVPSMVEDEAVSLFVDRAAHVRPGFALDAGNEDAVRTVCRRLDGIPLAIELAAAWIGVLAPAQVAAGLDDRFRLLHGRGGRGVVARQQTLAASVDWSHDLLDEGDRRVFRRLAVFAGGFGLDAARAVCGDPPGDGGRGDASDVLLALGRLIDKSLVVADDANGALRYRMLETIRQYALAQLQAAGETTTARDRHLDHFLAVAESAEPELEGADQDTWLARLEAEQDNLRTALDRGLSVPDPERGRRLAAALARLWLAHGHTHEGGQHLERAIARAPDDRSTLQARLLVGAAMVAAAGGRFEAMVAAVDQGLQIAHANGDGRNRARCLCLQSYLHGFFDFDAARQLATEARGHAQAADDTLGVDLSLVLEGLAFSNGDRHDDVRTVLDTAVQRCLERGDRMLAALALAGQTIGAMLTGDVRRGRQLASEAVRLAEPLGDYFTVGSATSNLAWVTGMAGDVDAGLRLLDRIVSSIEGRSHAVYVPTLAVTLGQLHLWRGDVETARQWFAPATRFAEPLTGNMVAVRARVGLADAYRRLGEADAARQEIEPTVASARDLDVPRVLADALDTFAHLVAANDPERAENLHHEALAARVDHSLRTHYTDSLDALAGCAARSGRHTEAARLWAASDAARDHVAYPRPHVDRAEHDTAVTAVRRTLGDAAFDAALAEGRALDLDGAVAYATRARGARGRPPTGWASLTPTERQVVTLVVEGLTNPEIGARLFMARSTVKTHLSHIYAKLGVTNRTELAALSGSRGVSSAGIE